MQCLMRFVAPQIKAVEQPVELLRREAHRLAAEVARPLETFAFEALVPQAKAVPLPIQDAQFGAVTVDKHIQCAAHRRRL